MATFERLPGHSLNVPDLYPLMHVAPPPVFDTQAIMQRGFDYIGKILDDLSPLNREERQAKLDQLRAQAKLAQMQAKDPIKFLKLMAEAKDPLMGRKARNYDIDYGNKILTGRLTGLKIQKAQSENNALGAFQGAMTEAMQTANDALNTTEVPPSQ
jgi:hypothetical protein